MLGLHIKELWIPFFMTWLGNKEVYIDDIVVKSQDFDKHLENLEKAFIKMRKYQLKVNPLKCAFGITAGNFLGFLVHNRSKEVDKNKAKAILQAKPP